MIDFADLVSEIDYDEEKRLIQQWITSGDCPEDRVFKDADWELCFDCAFDAYKDHKTAVHDAFIGLSDGITLTKYWQDDWTEKSEQLQNGNRREEFLSVAEKFVNFIENQLRFKAAVKDGVIYDN